MEYERSRRCRGLHGLGGACVQDARLIRQYAGWRIVGDKSLFTRAAIRGFIQLGYDCRRMTFGFPRGIPATRLP